MTRNALQLARWGVLLAGTLLLASLFNAAMTNGTPAIEQPTPSSWLAVDALADVPDSRCGSSAGTDRRLSAATDSLHDGDDLNARFRASLCANGLGGWTEP
jgi:hypothetical protein